MALQVGEQQLSYGELNAQANRLAHRLLALGVAPGQRIGLAMHRGPQLIVSLLAVLKALRRTCRSIRNTRLNASPT